MKNSIATALLVLLSLPVLAFDDAPRRRAQSRSHSSYEAELREPAPTPEVVQAAQQRTAYLADALQLAPAQRRMVHCATQQVLQNLYWLDPQPHGGRLAAETDLVRQYHRQLAGVLTARQYLLLLRLEPASPAACPSATHLAIQSRY